MEKFKFKILFILIIVLYIIYSISNLNIKIMLIILIIIIGIYIYNKDLLKNNNTLIKSKTNTNERSIVDTKTLIVKGEYTISLWIYIDDWNYKFGEIKEIIKRKNNVKGTNNPFIYLDLYENNIVTEFNTKGTKIFNEDSYNNAIQYCNDTNANIVSDNVNIDDINKLTCSLNPNNDKYEIKKKETGVNCVNGFYNCLNDVETDIPCNSDIIYNTIIENIPLQKWFHLSYSFGNNHVDSYLNGKLINTKTFNGVIFTEEYINSEFIICDNGGFSGHIKEFNYFNKVLSPQEVWDLYKKQHSNVYIKSILDRYRASVTFYEDNNEKVKYYIT